MDKFTPVQGHEQLVICGSLIELHPQLRAGLCIVERAVCSEYGSIPVPEDCSRIGHARYLLSGEFHIKRLHEVMKVLAVHWFPGAVTEEACRLYKRSHLMMSRAHLNT